MKHGLGEHLERRQALAGVQKDVFVVSQTLARVSSDMAVWQTDGLPKAAGQLALDGSQRRSLRDDDSPTADGSLMDRCEISIVVPAHNEERNIPLLYEAVDAAMKERRLSWELCFVDDGSTDGTAEAVRALMSADSRVRLVRFTRNFGHQAALMAGMASVEGDAIITLDCDLQHPPRLIPQMLDGWLSGSLLVEMQRTETRGSSFLKAFFSSGFYWLINMLSPIRIAPGVSDFRLLDRSLLTQLLLINDPKPFIRGMIAWMGYEPTRIAYVAETRQYGSPAYTLRRSLRLARQAILALSSQPLRYSVYASLIMVALCVLYLAYVAVASATGQSISGWASIVASVLIVGATQLMAIGLLGEYIAQIFDRVRSLPPYIILPNPKSNSNKDMS